MSIAVEVDTSDPTPPFEQLRRQIEAAIVAGKVAPGARLPTVRQLAADLGVAPGTVMRAYKELDAQGLIASRRGGGSVVAEGVGGADESAWSLHDALRDVVATARTQGFGNRQIRKALDDVL